jgi:succinate dehydrogenase/fumarate reductase flavoprotein subunit
MSNIERNARKTEVVIVGGGLAGSTALPCLGAPG